MKAVMEFFGMKIGEFRKEWAELTDQDKEHLKTGVADGTLTY